MVTAEKRASPPRTGCVQVLAARDWRAALSSPRAGGELNSEPTTEKRKRAHKAVVDRREESLMAPAHESDEDKTFIVRVANCWAGEIPFANVQHPRPVSHDRKCRRDDE